MDKKKFYITTPIYYPSDKLHIGHTYCTVATDAMARYKRLTGYDVMFLTGTDEHGQKIEDKAKAAGVTPQQFVDNIVCGEKGILDLWKLMNISNDRFIRTTDDYHVEAIQKIFKTGELIFQFLYPGAATISPWLSRNKMNIPVVLCSLNLRKKSANFIQGTVYHFLALCKLIQFCFKVLNQLLIFPQKLRTDLIGICGSFHSLCGTVHILTHGFITGFP